MELEKLDKESLIQLVKKLGAGMNMVDIEKGWIPLSTRRNIDAIHTIFCTEKHSGEGACPYYEETKTDDPWAGVAHKKWANHLINNMTKHAVSDQDVTIVCHELFQVMHSRERLKKQSPNAEALFLSLLKEDFRSLIG
jgi:hypothetical protein